MIAPGGWANSRGVSRPAGRRCRSSLPGPVVGPVIGKPLREVMTAFLGPDKEEALEALVRLEQSGNAIDMLTADAAGQPLELVGQSRGGQLRLVLRGSFGSVAAQTEKHLWS